MSEAYDRLGGGPEPPDVAVRSSATAEDLPDASFAGQQETISTCRAARTARSVQALLRVALHRSGDLLSRRQGVRSFKIALSIGVQQMVRSDLAASGVMFTIDTETGFPNAVLINAAYGLGENVVRAR